MIAGGVIALVTPASNQSCCRHKALNPNLVGAMHSTLPATKGQVAQAFFQISICHVEPIRLRSEPAPFGFAQGRL